MSKKQKKTKRELYEKKEGVVKEFIAFINKGNAVAMAIGVIIGSAFSAIVTAINTNIISPLIALLVGDVDLSESLVTVLKKTPTGELDENRQMIYNVIAIKWGALLEAIINFLLVALILFAITKIVTSIWKKVDKLNKDVKSKIDAQLEKKFEKEEAKLHEADETETAEEEPVKEETPVEQPAVEEPKEAPVDAQIELLKEIRDLLKESK